jgi:uncharacterized protein (TIGR00661 family)
MANYSNKRILICPLDWGLGHATRCIPIIQGFLQKGCEVIIASNGQALRLLKTEFPQLSFHELPAYNPHYSAFLPMTFAMGLQLPKFLRVIKQEHQNLEKIIVDRKIDIVISDNRYGCWSNKIRSIFITNQANIIVPWYLKAGVDRFNKKCINRFSLCWIPDYEGEKSLTGKLSQISGSNVRFIGPISRFEKLHYIEKQYDILAVISGPEPQRSIFEKLIRKELIKSNRKSLLVRGIPSNMTIVKNSLHDEVEFLTANDLNFMIHASDIVISRSGFGMISDLVKLGKSAILVPTPGQTEQVYLAKTLKEKGIIYSENQRGFNLERSLKKMNSYKNLGEIDGAAMGLSKAIDEVL